MREIRTSGSEGGGTEANRFSLPLCAPVSVFGLRGGSPLQACTLRPVIEGNCVLMRGGGKQPEMNEQSVGDELDSAGPTGEPARARRSPELACRAEGLCDKATAGAVRWLETECSEGQTREAGRPEWWWGRCSCEYS